MEKQQQTRKSWLEFLNGGTQVKLHYSNGDASPIIGTSSLAMAMVVNAEGSGDISSTDAEEMIRAIGEAEHLPQYQSKAQPDQGQQETMDFVSTSDDRARSFHEGSI
jgi:hypothetical protein